MEKGSAGHATNLRHLSIVAAGITQAIAAKSLTLLRASYDLTNKYLFGNPMLALFESAQFLFKREFIEALFGHLHRFGSQGAERLTIGV